MLGEGPQQLLCRAKSNAEQRDGTLASPWLLCRDAGRRRRAAAGGSQRESAGGDSVGEDSSFEGTAEGAASVAKLCLHAIQHVVVGGEASGRTVEMLNLDVLLERLGQFVANVVDRPGGLSFSHAWACSA
eukprot:COSAG03_NODE_9471_length_717_cov_0.982201_1_plen_129_part_01